MRRLVVLALGTLVAALLPSPALADTTVVVHDYPVPGSTGLYMGRVGCEDAFHTSGYGGFPTMMSDGTAPLGDYAWHYDLDAPGDANGPYVDVDSLLDTTVVGTSVYAPGGTTMVGYVIYQAPADAGTTMVWAGRGSWVLPASDTWTDVTVDPQTEVLTWTRWDNAPQVQQADTPVDDTLPGFLASHGGDQPGAWNLGFGCGSAPFAVDAVRVGSVGDVTTWDLENLTTSLVAGLSREEVTAGQQVTVSGDVTDGASGEYPDLGLDLEWQPLGQPDFTHIATVATGASGEAATVGVRPPTNTAYRWSFNGAPCCAPGVSQTLWVQVHARVTLKLVDSSLRVGDRLVATGAVTPTEPGDEVTLWRKTPTGRAEIGRDTVNAKGLFRVETKVRKAGTWRLFATVPADADNLAGTSTTRRLVIRR